MPELAAFDAQLKATDGREICTTMAFVRILNTLLRDKKIGKHVVPIVPDESRTFGMEGMFRQFGIFSQVGQLYRPEDADQLMFYKEDKTGQILQEGINEAGAMSSWIAAATSYSTNDVPMIPFYIYYSMFGFQRVGDLAWAAGDMRARGFLLGGTAGRTTLNGEGLQHEDGHSHVLASTIPNCVSYDPTFSYEVAVIVQDGLRRMFAEQEDVFYYITLMNENYEHPAMPEGAADGHPQGHVPARAGEAARSSRACSCWARGTILREVMAGGRPAAQDLACRRRHLELPQLHRAAARRDRGRALEPAAPDRDAAAEPCRGLSRADRGPGGRGDRLHAAPSPTRSAPCAAALPRAGHRRLRPLGLSPQAAPLLRGGPALGRAGRARRRWPRKARCRPAASPRRSRNTASIRRSRTRTIGAGARSGASGGSASRRRQRHIEVTVPDIGDFKDVPVIEIHVKPGDTVKADDPLVTLESDKATMDVPAAAGRHGREHPGQDRRQGERGRRRSLRCKARGAADAPVTRPLDDHPAGAGAAAQPTPAPAPAAAASPAPRHRAAAADFARRTCQPRRAPAPPASSTSIWPSSRARARRAGSPRRT